MLYIYTGNPASGKSLNAAKKMYDSLLSGKESVIANYDIDHKYLDEMIRVGNIKTSTKFTYVNNQKLTYQFLIEYANANHSLKDFEKKRIAQTTVFIDEWLQFGFDLLTYDEKKQWIYLFENSNRFAFDFVIISQHTKFIDPNILGLVDYEMKHEKKNEYGIFSIDLYLYGKDKHLKHSYLIYDERYSKLYTG